MPLAAVAGETLSSCRGEKHCYKAMRSQGQLSEDPAVASGTQNSDCLSVSAELSHNCVTAGYRREAFGLYDTV